MPSISDSLFQFDAGQNAGVPAMLLPRNQLSKAVNATMRGGYAKARPRFTQVSLVGNPAAIVQLLSGGKFRGAGYFKPNDGSAEYMIAVVGPHVFSVGADGAVDYIGDTAVSDMSATGSQAYIWQSELWAIINDGVVLPTFWDGTTARKSVGPTLLSIYTTAADFVVPAVGKAVTIQLDDQWLSPNATPDRFFINGRLYKFNGIVSICPYATAVLTNLDDPRNGGGAGNDPRVIRDPANAGYVTADVHITSPTNNITVIGSIVPSWVQTGGSSDYCFIQGLRFLLVSVSHGSVPGPETYTLTPTSDFSGATLLTGSQITLNTTLAPARTLTNLSNAFLVPAIGANVTVRIDSVIPAGIAGTGNYVVIDGFNYYVVSTALVTPTADTFISAINTGEVPGVTVPSGTDLQGGDTDGNGLPELPIGLQGAYVMGRNWIALPDGRTFMAGDLVGLSSGTIAYNFRDAVLKTTENQFLLGGGNFCVPGSSGEITAIMGVPTLDASLGQGPVQVLTPRAVFSCAAPVDRTTWQNMTNPILTESLISNGGMGQNSTTLANGDLIFRSKDGMRSLILARRDFATWGNVPMSREVQPTFDADDPSLLNWCSAVVFDNRLLVTAHPVVHSTYGSVYHDTLAVLNFDPVSSLRGKAPAIWEGTWTGFNVLQMVVGEFSGAERCFAFCQNTTSSLIELWEIHRTADDATYGTAVTWTLESPMMFNQADPKNRKHLRLSNGEVDIDTITAAGTCSVYFRADANQAWMLWYAFVVPATPAYQMRMGLGEPPDDPDSATGLTARDGYSFQVKIEIDGNYRFLGARFQAVEIPEPSFAVLQTSL